MPPEPSPPSDRSPLLAPGFAAAPGWRHGFSDRRRGVPRGARLEDHLPALLAAVGLPRDAPWCRLRQVHGTDVHEGRSGGEPPAGDGLVSDRPGLVLVIQTADCLPVLLADTAAGVAGAAHAGWRGLVAGVLEATLEAMVRLGARPERVEAALGPAIGPCCFEVGEEVAAPFQRIGPDLVRRDSSRPRVDLPAAARRLLAAAGVGTARSLGACTRCRVDSYFSHRGESGQAGRLLSIIAPGPPQAPGAPSTR